MVCVNGWGCVGSGQGLGLTHLIMLGASSLPVVLADLSSGRMSAVARGGLVGGSVYCTVTCASRSTMLWRVSTPAQSAISAQPSIVHAVA